MISAHIEYAEQFKNIAFLYADTGLFIFGAKLSIITPQLVLLLFNYGCFMYYLAWSFFSAFQAYILHGL